LPLPFGVENHRGPPLRLRGITGLIEHLRVHPSEHLPAAAEPDGVVRVETGTADAACEARIDEQILLRLRVEDRASRRFRSSGTALPNTTKSGDLAQEKICASHFLIFMACEEMLIPEYHRLRKLLKAKSILYF